MRFKKHFLMLAVFNVIFFASLFSQEDKSLQIKKCARLETGFALHFLSANDDNKIIPGAVFQYCYGIKSDKKLGVGIGGGFEYFEKELFFPIFIDAVYFFNQKKNTSFINLKAGYSLGWSNSYSDLINSNFKGGPDIGICFGKKY